MLSLDLSDITAGQVVVTMRERTGRVVVGPQSMREGDVVAFQHVGGTYRLALNRLVNLLVGDDYAVFRVTPDSRAPVDERARIERLLQALEKSGARFVRNGKVATAAEAAAHLRQKLAAVPSNSVASVEQFIERLATRSSTSGTPYRVLTPDGRDVPAADWLREVAKDL